MLKAWKKYIIVLSAVLFIVGVSGCAGQNSGKVTVTTVSASNQELELPLDLSGVLAPAQSVNISSRISGQVTSLGFKVGSAVKTGDILMQLDTAAINGQLLQAQAGLQSAQASAQAAENQAALSKISLDAAQKNFDRTKALFEAGAASQSQLDDDKNKLDTAAKQYENAFGPTQDQAQAAIATAQANIKNLDVQLDISTIKSPLDGILTSQSVSVGEVVSPGVGVISIVDITTLRLRSTVTQDNLPLLSNGQQIDVTVDSFPNNKYAGIVTTVGPISLNTGEVFPVEISIKNDGQLMAGLSAHASLTAKAKGIIVPPSALVQSSGESYVFVIKDNKASKRVVKTGLKSDKGIQILQGLVEGEKVAATNVSALADNRPVVVKQ
ncbi:MAG TPA: efflux RND transporter periplasmic adaptor subunit [Syntrophomonadaceae bacterium]|nr:efflux RND transporter periplasmic adaptor subunit [Syntrophomonadaceae bacterium]